MDRNWTWAWLPVLNAWSLSARRAWIEMLLLPSLLPICVVALRKESVDRNRRYYATIKSICVALRKESVDRNKKLMTKLLSDTVALRKESVDRNGDSCRVFLYHGMSLSARRAWIEIVCAMRIQPAWMRRSPQGERG